jgi:DNA-binding GntR family transcriptional regulator
MANPNNLSNELISGIRQDILAEVMPPGSKITEHLLCNRYNVSRTPVREALRNLESEGLIELIPNRGAFVVGFSSQDIDDLFQMRKVLEGQATRWAIERRTKEEFEALLENYEFMEYYTPRRDITKITELNTVFHRIIYLASHNRMMTDILTQYHVYLQHSSKVAIYQEEDLEKIFEEHRGIFEAFKRNDPEMGEAAAMLHTERSYTRITV